MFTIYIIPLMIIIVGYLMYKYPPKKINWIVGYRTPKSMQNEKSWKLANMLCGRLWIYTGLVLFAMSLVISILEYAKLIVITETILAIVVLIQVVIIILPIFLVERKLKRGNIK